MKFLDLHTHTAASDGILTPSQLVDLAANRGLSVLSITDHDTTDGLEEGARLSGEKNITFIPGIEFSVEHPSGSYHLLGYYIDHGSRELQQLIRSLKEKRGTRIYRMIDDLKEHGIDIPLQEVLATAQGGSMGRPHVARVLVAHGYAISVKEVFANFLVKGKPGYVKKDKVTVDDAVRSIQGAGGVPVIAHPISLECRDMNEFETFLKKMILRGVMGIEAYSSMHSGAEVREFIALAGKYNLLVTGGSDFHGDKNEKIGWYTDDDPIPFDIFGALDRHRGATGA